MPGFNLMRVTGFPMTVDTNWSAGEGLANITDGDFNTEASATVGWSGGSESQISRYYTVTFPSAIKVLRVIVKTGSTSSGGGNWGGADSGLSVSGVYQSPPGAFNSQTIGTYDSITDYPAGWTGVTSIRIDIRSGRDWHDGYHSATVHMYELEIYTSDSGYGAML